MLYRQVVFKINIWREMKHILKLQPEPFEKIKNGTKVIESRLHDEKRKKIHIGDQITFLKNPELKESIDVTVTDLLPYDSFDHLMSDFPAELFGGKSKADLLREIHQFYSNEDEQQYGVLGIKIELLSK